MNQNFAAIVLGGTGQVGGAASRRWSRRLCSRKARAFLTHRSGAIASLFDLFSGLAPWGYLLAPAEAGFREPSEAFMRRTSVTPVRGKVVANSASKTPHQITHAECKTLALRI